MIPAVKEDASFEGKVYGIPYSFENITYNWRVDYANAVGADRGPRDVGRLAPQSLSTSKSGARTKRSTPPPLPGPCGPTWAR